MPFQMRMAVGNAGMVEVERRLGLHADTLHDGARAAVRRDREGHDLSQAEFSKPNASQARAASVTMPRPQNSGASRQPISTEPSGTGGMS